VGVRRADQVSDTGKSLPVHLTRAIGAVRQLPVALLPLDKEPSATASLLSEALRDPTRRTAALLSASLLDPVITMLSLGILVGLAASDRDAVLVRQVLGRLSHYEVLARVPPIVDVLLDDADDHDYRRYAELLVHLGLADALRELCSRAMKSPDSGIREVAAEFR
jgi:hypothetical protein